MNATKASIWKALQAHAQRMKNLSLRELFAADRERFAHFSCRIPRLFADFSKQRVDTQVLAELLRLADVSELAQWRGRMFRGEVVNSTEGRAAWHVALRDPQSDAGARHKARMKAFAEAFRSGEIRGFSGKPLRHVVCLGIGGSDLGPKLAHHALHALHHPDIRIEFVSHADGVALEHLLKRLDPAETMFVVTSKTFATAETLLNARTARDWLLVAAGDAGIGRQFAAVTGAPAKAIEFGIDVGNILEMHDWVGGRYSVWSSVGLPVALALGWEAFERFLAGAAEMDRHFLEAPLQENLPVLMAMLGIWNTNFLGISSLAVLPYSESLRYLPAHLQQLEMESNSKSVDRQGKQVRWHTNPLVWGGMGMDGQHAYFQWLHQGTDEIACDFVAVIAAESGLRTEHRELTLANCLAQSAALAFGRNESEVQSRLLVASPEQTKLLPHRVCPGNKPSTTLLLDALTPESLGALIALYEHKVFVQGVVWEVNSFDQWGVELGKEMAANLLAALRGAEAENLDGSTAGLLRLIRAAGEETGAASAQAGDAGVSTATSGTMQPQPGNLPAVFRPQQQAPEQVVLSTYNPQALSSVAVRKDYNLAVKRESEQWLAAVKGATDRVVAQYLEVPSVEKLGEGSVLLMNHEQSRKNEINLALARLQAVLGQKDKRLVDTLAQSGATELSLYRDARLRLDVKKAAIRNAGGDKIKIRVKSGGQLRVLLSMHRDNKKKNATPHS